MSSIKTMTRWSLLCLVLLLVLLQQVQSKFRCHNNCNGHGICNDDNYCWCDSGYQGVDCSDRSCDLGRAWADKAYDLNEAHVLTECSDRGKCNRRTGVCQCYDGFTGVACQKATCGASNCNGHGFCSTLNQAYQQYTSFQNQVSTYDGWETNHVTMCVCDLGYTGPDCSYRLCPRGDDPLTPATGFRSIDMIVDVNPSSGGLIRFSFNGQSFFFPPDPVKFTEHECKKAFESMANVEKVNCTLSRWNARRSTYSIIFLKFPSISHENNVFDNDGNPRLSQFACDTSTITDKKGHCILSDVVTGDDADLPEYALCSNRGVCDLDTGLCNCIEEFAGGNCDTFAEGMFMYSTSVNSDVLALRTENPLFRAAVLRLHSNTPGNDRFNFMTVESPATTMWKLTGGGNIEMNYGGVRIGKKSVVAVASSGAGIVGGLKLRGGVRVRSQGLYSAQLLNVEEGLYVDRDGVEVSGIVHIEEGLYSSDAFVVNTRGVRLQDGVAVTAGGATISLGGMSLFDGVSVNSGGVTVLKRGVTIMDSGLRIISGGLSLTGASQGLDGLIGLTIPSGGFVGDGGLTVVNLGLYSTPEGLTIGGGGMRVSTGLTVDSGGMVVTGGFTFHAADIVVNDGMRVYSGGFHSTAGFTVASDGVVIRSDGLVVEDGLTITDVGMAVTGGLIISSADLITPDMSVTPRGLRSTGNVDLRDGLMVSAGGLTVTGVMSFVDNSGVSVVNGGLVITGGLTVSDAGAAFSGPLSISSSGLTVVSGSISVSSGGFNVVGGITVTALGLISQKGLSIASAGARVTGIVTVETEGLVVSASGLSITGTGVQLVAGGLAINNVGFAITQGLTIVSDGVFIATSGISVRTNGMYVTNGVTLQSANLVTHSLFVTGGIRSQTQFQVRQGGLGIDVDGLSISANGVAITNGLSIGSSGLVVSAGSVTSLGPYTIDGGITSDAAMRFDGLYVQSGGFYSTLGMTVPTGGAAVSKMDVIGGLSIDGTVTVMSSGVISDVLTRVTSSGLTIDDSITVQDVGIRVTGGCTVYSNGMDVKVGGLTVTSGGLIGVSAVVNSIGGSVNGPTAITSLGVSAGFLTVSSQGAVVTGGIVVNDGGAVATGTTLRSRGIRINAGNLVAKNAVVSGGIVVHSTGLNLQGGITLAQGMLVRSNGMTFGSNGFRLKGVGQLRVDSDGFSVNGGCTVYGDTRLQSSPTLISDERLKYDFETLQDPLEKVGKLRGVYYRLSDEFEQKVYGRNSTGANPSLREKHVGVIAQEVRAVLPEAVHQFDAVRDYLSVSYEELVPLLVEAVKELDGKFGDTSSPEFCDCELEEQLVQATQLVDQLEEESKRLLELLQEYTMKKSIM